MNTLLTLLSITALLWHAHTTYTMNTPTNAIEQQAPDVWDLTVALKDAQGNEERFEEIVLANPHANWAEVITSLMMSSLDEGDNYDLTPQIPAIKYLLKKGVDLTQAEHFGFHPLVWLSAHNDPASLKILRWIYYLMPSRPTLKDIENQAKIHNLELSEEASKFFNNPEAHTPEIEKKELEEIKNARKKPLFFSSPARGKRKLFKEDTIFKFQ